MVPSPSICCSLLNETDFLVTELTFDKVIGKGSFGKVRGGEWREQEVAIKEATVTSPEVRADFLSEAQLMLYVDDLN